MYSYEYDKLGQLVRYNDKVANKSYTYTYDNNGNILTKSEYAYTTGALGVATDTTTYSYEADWADKLTKVDGQEITYDNIGNPLSYLGATLTWQGRQLTSYSNAENTFNYEYDENGMRYRTTITSKEDNSVGYLDYVWVDSKLISISFTSDELNQTVKYLYNDFDEPVGFVATREDGSVDTFYYLKNAQGDITHIVSAAGKKMVTFTYDVFGKRTVTYQANGSTTPGQIELLTQMKADLLNPFAYRGYCYDYDMGMYYLQSRYYDPNVGRFINADDTNYLNATGTVLGCNLFAYCENDPVNKVDPRGFVSYSKNYIKQIKLIIQRFLKGLLKGKTINQRFNIAVDDNYMHVVDIKYYKTTQTCRKIRLTFGNPTAWTKSLTSYYIDKHGAKLETHTDAILNEMEKNASFENAKNVNQTTIIFSSAVLLYASINTSVYKSTVKAKMKKAANLFGSRYYMFYVTKELSYNGLYAYSVDSFKVTKI